MEGGDMPHHHPPPPPPHPHQQVVITVADPGDSRFPQWTVQETNEFLMIRAELDRSFMETKRNKLLWEVISTRMKEKGFNRSAEQCKCKWKNMVTRYKGCETMEPAAMILHQFPFYNELHAIFTARMQRLMWAEAEGAAAPSGTSSKRSRTFSTSGMLSSDEEDDVHHHRDTPRGSRKKNKPIRSNVAINAGGSCSTTPGNIMNMINSLKEVLEGFMTQQLQMEMQWREAWEAREEERRRQEMEWRQMMGAWENERLRMEREWREREEQRRVRGEAWAERRDALVNALLSQLRRDV